MQRFTFVASLILLSLGLLWPKFYESFQNNTALAMVTSNRGTTEWISRRNLRGQGPMESLDLRLNESLATGTDGHISLRFKRGAEIAILPGSFITLTKKAGKTLIALRRGDIEVLTEGEENSVLITQNGQDLPLRDYASSVTPPPVAIDPQSFVDTKTVEPESNISQGALDAQSAEPPLNQGLIPANRDPLTPVTAKQTKNLQDQIRRMITDRVSRQRNHLFRCYSNLIQKQKNAQGKLNLHFVVNNLGKVEDTMIVKTEIPDKKFENCLLQIIKRTEFLPFEGQKVSTYLPLRFDKNLKTAIE